MPFDLEKVPFSYAGSYLSFNRLKPKRSTPKWLADAVVYQVYPQSFCDANGDGIGDLPGLISKLDYIRSLGATVVWLNPVLSPFGDAGYDIRDFCRVAPRYGTNADLKRLFKEAHRRGLREIGRAHV